MKKNLKIVGIIFIILGGIAISMLFADGFNFYEIDNQKLLGGIVFIAISFPAFGFQFIRRSKL